MDVLVFGRCLFIAPGLQIQVPRRTLVLEWSHKTGTSTSIAFSAAMTPTAGPTGDGPWPPVAPGDSVPKVKVDILETTDEQGGLGIVEESTRQQRAGSSRADLPHSQELTLQCACDLWDGDIVVERTFVHFPNPSSERATSLPHSAP